MTISSADSRASYNGNGVTTTFAITFDFLSDPANVLVTHIDALGVETTWVSGTHYDVVGSDVVVKTTPTDYTPATGEKLVFLLGLSYIQPTDYLNGGDLDAEGFERGLDRVTLMVKRVVERVSRAMTASIGLTADLQLPSPSAGKAIKWNATADGFENSTYDPDTQQAAAAASAAAALASETAAAASAAAALASENNAATSETNAAASEANAAASYADVVAAAAAFLAPANVSFTSDADRDLTADENLANVVVITDGSALQARVFSCDANEKYLFVINNGTYAHGIKPIGGTGVYIPADGNAYRVYTNGTSLDFVANGKVFIFTDEGVHAHAKLAGNALALSPSDLPDILIAAAGTYTMASGAEVTKTNGTLTTTSVPYVVGGTINADRIYGTCRATCQHRTDNSKLVSYLQVKKNGNVVGGPWTTSSTSFQTRTADFSIAVGDVITFEHHISGGGGSSYIQNYNLTANKHYSNSAFAAYGIQ